MYICFSRIQFLIPQYQRVTEFVYNEEIKRKVITFVGKGEMSLPEAVVVIEFPNFTMFEHSVIGN